MPHGSLPLGVGTESAVLELYDVVALPGVRCPMAIGFKSDEIRWMVTMG